MSVDRGTIIVTCDGRRRPNDWQVEYRPSVGIKTIWAWGDTFEGALLDLAVKAERQRLRERKEMYEALGLTP